MKLSHKILFVIILTLSLISCFNFIKVDEYSAQELIWCKPFDKTDTIIFVSEKNDRDTIIFHKIDSGNASTRSFEQGFYNSKYMKVSYEFTEGSYHEFITPGAPNERLKDDFIYLIKSSDGNSYLEIKFIGTIFSDESLKTIQKLNDSDYFFDSKKATYSSMNVEKGIKNYTFNAEIGILKYTDDRNVKWKRK